MRALYLCLAITFALAAPLAAAERLVVRQSKFPVKETMDRLAAAIEARGLKVALRVDHAAAARAAGLDLPPTEVVMFGNPKLGTPLMQASPAIAIDLPMRMLAWQDSKGRTWIGYAAPKALKARHGVKGQDASFNAMATALDGLAVAAAPGN